MQRPHIHFSYSVFGRSTLRPYEWVITYFVFSMTIHPLPPAGYSPCLRGRVSYNTAQADCPPETGATRSEATEGVDSFPFYYSPLVHQAKAVAFAHQAPQVRFPFILSLQVGISLTVVTTPLHRGRGKGEGLPLSLSYIPCLSIFLYNA